MHAVAFRDHLVQNGVPAQVVGGNTDASASWGRGVGAYEVVLASRDDAELAALLLEQYDSEAPVFEHGLDHQATPDLSVLDPAMAPPCPACGAVLPLEASLARCPACDADVDVAALIVATHGPEALAACYEAGPSAEELMAMEPAHCGCGGPIDGRGACAWCGRRTS